MSSVLLPRAAIGAWVLTVGILAVGCTTGVKPAGKVSGAVRYKGAPVASGNVNFQSNDGTNTGGVAKIDGGHYAFETTLPVGSYDVFLTESYPDPVPGVETKPVPSGVPKKFLIAATSGVKAEVKSGSNDIPIDLTD